MSDQSMKHPPALWTLFLSEMWERFCYYGMRALLALFLIESMMKGNSEAFLIYGAYTALVYAAPILGGRLADKFLGYQYAIMLGAVLMSIGEFLIVASTDLLDLDRALRDSLMLIGMGGLIVGNGYFKANISTIVGKLYADGDPRRDSGFTIFYIGINVGALLATTVVAVVGKQYGFEYGFGLAGLGMLAGLFIFWSGRKKYAHVPNIDITEAGREKWLGMERWKSITILSLLLIPLCYVLISQNNWLIYLLIGIFVLVVFQLISAGVKEGGKTGMTSIVIGVCFLLCLFFAPLATSLPKEIDGAALVYVSILFVKNIVNIGWGDIGESAPAVIAMIAMPLTYSISTGMALAFISYALIKLGSGKVKGVSPAIWLIAILGTISIAI